MYKTTHVTSTGPRGRRARGCDSTAHRLDRIFRSDDFPGAVFVCSIHNSAHTTYSFVSQLAAPHEAHKIMWTFYIDTYEISVMSSRATSFGSTSLRAQSPGRSVGKARKKKNELLHARGMCCRSRPQWQIAIQRVVVFTGKRLYAYHIVCQTCHAKSEREREESNLICYGWPLRRVPAHVVNLKKTNDCRQNDFDTIRFISWCFFLTHKHIHQNMFSICAARYLSSLNQSRNSRRPKTSSYSRHDKRISSRYAHILRWTLVSLVMYSNHSVLQPILVFILRRANCMPELSS